MDKLDLLKELITEQLNHTNDEDLLDLVYKLLISES